MSKNEYGMQKPVQNDLHQCINGFKRMEKGGIGVANEYIKQACEMALKHIDELEAKLANAVEVVRCRDCRFSGSCSIEEFGCTEPDDYCSRGKRKEPDNG